MQHSANAKQQLIAALWELTDTNIQHLNDHKFAYIPILDGSKREEFFELLESLEATCIQSGRDIYPDALVWDCLLSRLSGQPQRDSWELRKMFF